jgi:hypothetical protein
MAGDEGNADDVILDLNQFRRVIAEITRTDPRIKQVTAKLGPLRKAQRMRKQALMDFMRKTGYRECYVNGRRECISILTKSKPVKLDEEGRLRRIQDALRTTGGTPEQAQAVYDYIFDNPEKEDVDQFSFKLSAYGRRTNTVQDVATLPDAKREALESVDEEITEKIRRNLAVEV